ncbi:hypothetical protein AMTR_s00344p00015180 [Amborella trichopoda]|uniref:protein-serine/threonine phosphatase n=1 Tax=Amborella trichopoda TaxID=13333 RepID=W1NPN8_AMBTC|nr:hypothetical protein AMTR_s00344p00015180 [Amborella trichopoda]
MALIQKSGPIVSNNLHGLNPSISSHLIQVREAGNSTFGSNPLINSQPRRSRDPRLANTNYEVSSSIDPVNVKPIKPILNGGILDSRKTKVVEEAVVDGHSLKRQRGLSYGGQVMPGRGGCLEEKILGNLPSSKEQRVMPGRGGCLEEKILGNLPSSKEQRVEISDSMKERLVKPENGTVLGSYVKLDGNININISTALRPDAAKGLEALQRHVNPLPQNISSSSSTCTMMPLNTGAPLSMSSMKEDVGKPRMKPRDPRQILHTNLIPTDVSSTPQPKSNGTDPSTIHFSTITSSSQELNMSVNPIPSLPLSTNLPDKERARRIEEQNKMFSAQKLSLVLDLDHTLLNSAKFIEVDRVHDEILKKKEEQDRLWECGPSCDRGFGIFLKGLVYATEIAKLLDPTGSLFAGRVIPKGDDGDPFDTDKRLQKSKDLDGVLGMESAVVIIDDSANVWPHHKHNLIVVERYTYFPCSRRQFGFHGPSLLEINHDERPKDGTLASSLAVIETIHQSFFSNRSLDEVDVKEILASEKFGAICTNQIDDEVTHVVAISLGTDKVNWAMSTGRYVVHPGWLEASTLLYQRANERDFPIMSPPPSS